MRVLVGIRALIASLIFSLNSGLDNSYIVNICSGNMSSDEAVVVIAIIIVAVVVVVVMVVAVVLEAIMI